VANHKSAKKRARQALRRRDRNRHDRSEMRSAVKLVRTALEAGNAEAATGALKQAESKLRRASSKGLIHWKTASRRISRLTKATNRVASA
jgi:small subunit ribosomal protein S20